MCFCSSQKVKHTLAVMSSAESTKQEEATEIHKLITLDQKERIKAFDSYALGVASSPKLVGRGEDRKYLFGAAGVGSGSAPYAKVWNSNDSSEEVYTWEGKRARACAFNKDATIFAIGLDGSYDIEVYDTLTWKPLREPVKGCSSFINYMEFSQTESNICAAATDDSTVRIIDVAPESESMILHQVRVSGHINGVAFSPSFEKPVLAAVHGETSFISVITGKVESTYSGLSANVGAYTHHDAKNPLVALAGGNGVHVLDGNTFEKLFVMPGISGHTSGLCFSPLGNLLAGCSWSRKLVLWDMKQKRTIAQADAGSDLRACCFVLPYCREIVAGDMRGNVIVYRSPVDVAWTEKRIPFMIGHCGKKGTKIQKMMEMYVPLMTTVLYCGGM